MLLKMKMIAINKHSIILKDMSVKMPNAPYSNRYMKYDPKNGGESNDSR